MDIAQYILDLLNEHNEVSLPGVGTFFKRSTSAYHNTETGLYHPPSHSIDFKSDEGSGELLVSHITSTKHISESSAQYFIERFCESVRSSLDVNSSAEVLPLGTLTKTDKGYSFQSGIQTSSEYFGLRPIKEPATLNGNNTKAVVTEPIHESTEETEVEESGSGSRTIWIILGSLLVLTALAGLAYLLYPQYFTNQKTPAKKSVPTIVPVELKTDSLADSMSFADSIVDQLEKQGLHGSEVQKTPDSVTISSTTSKPDSLTVAPKPKPKRVYEIVVASFGLRREAEASVKGFRRKGIDAKVVADTKKPKFKVSIGSFTSKVAANKENKRIQKELTKEAWILTVINKEN